MSSDFTELHGKYASELDIGSNWMVGCRVCRKYDESGRMIVVTINKNRIEFVCPSCHDAWGS